MTRPASESRGRLEGLADRLNALSPVPDHERRSLVGLWRDVRELPTRGVLPSDCKLGLVVSGWACHQRRTAGGRRQIVSFLTPGDSHCSRDGGVASIEALCLTRVHFLDVSVLLQGAPAAEHPGLVSAMGVAEQRRLGYLINHIERLASRDARSGLAHLILELEARTARTAQADGWFALPIGQRILGYAMGFSTVHVNKTLTRLREEGLLELRAGWVRVVDRPRLEALADG